MRLVSKFILLTGMVMTSAWAFGLRKVILHGVAPPSRIVTTPTIYHQSSSSSTLLQMGFLKDMFEAPNVASKSRILKAFQSPNAVVIDARSEAEIQTKVDAKHWINAPGSPFNNPTLQQDGSKLLPDKTAPIIVYCASGKRSQKAADILIQQGYTNVFNAGGIGQIDYLPIVQA